MSISDTRRHRKLGSRFAPQEAQNIKNNVLDAGQYKENDRMALKLTE
jgi:hypothetical protein